MPISSRHKQRPGEWRDVLAPEVINNFRGKHIAIIHKKVVAVGETYEHVRVQAEELFPNEMPYLAYIPEDDSEYPDEDQTADDPRSAAG
jgi:hypothetical protein